MRMRRESSIALICGFIASLALQAVYDGEGWISLGFSDDGRMVPADAVIGLPDEATALEYFLTNKVSNVGEGKRRHKSTVAVQLEAVRTSPFASSSLFNHRTSPFPVC